MRNFFLFKRAGDAIRTLRRTPEGSAALHLFLFFSTLYSVTLAGVLFPYYLVGSTGRMLALMKTITKFPPLLFFGFAFSLPLIAILLAHEMGHYIASKKHGLKATLPFFIPGPTIFGTFGAFIRIKSPIRDRKALIDVGAAGPLAGFAVTIPVLIAGLALAEPRSFQLGPDEHSFAFSEPLIMQFFSLLIHGPLEEDMSITMNLPLFAAWTGLLVTSLNLFPVGQLDGGHILYALSGRAFKLLSRVALLLTFLAGFRFPGWFVWAALLFILGTRHPPLLDESAPLDGKRTIIGILSFLILAVSLMPFPIEIITGQ